jgi:mRNA interferase MazF
MYKKYDIVSINLNPKKWHTQAWIRPCIVIQNNIFNSKSPTLVVVPLTTNIKVPFPSEFIIEPSLENWLQSNSRFLWSQIITIDKDFVIEKIWTLEIKYFQEIKKALFIALDIEDDF